MSKFLTKASSPISDVPAGRFEKYNLIENPFPSQAVLNKDSKERKFNGSIYEPGIRTAEYEKILNNFIRIPQNNISHQRLGFLLDSSYIGRGNGKTAFLLNLIRGINKDYCLDLSNGVNKCFAAYLQPEGGGRTKTFEAFVDILFQTFIDSEIVSNSLAILRAESLINLIGSDDFLSDFNTEEDFVGNLNSDSWFRNELTKYTEVTKKDVTKEILKSSFLQNISRDFPLYKDSTLILSPLVTQSDFAFYYSTLKKGKERLDFVFSELVSLFLAAGFNGSYVFIDDFERIPDHQSAIQKRDFVTQLRTVLYDGLYLNSKIGFYNFIFALHAGVPRILQEAWDISGLEHRVSLNPTFDNPRHMILFDKINESHAVLLIEKYLSEFRFKPASSDFDKLYPFTSDAIKLIGVKSELNAAKILQMANNIIEQASEDSIEIIDLSYVAKLVKQSNINAEINSSSDSISKTETVDLLNKINNE